MCPTAIMAVTARPKIAKSEIAHRKIPRKFGVAGYHRFLAAPPTHVCGGRRDRLKTARGQGAPIPVLGIRPLGLRPRSLGLRPCYLCLHAIMGVA